MKKRGKASVSGTKARTGGRGGKRKASAEPPPVVLTIGHSTRTLEEFIGLLQAHGATRVVDVRTVPRSRHNPQFNKASLPRALKKAGLGYVHLPGLGGLRHAQRDSLNLGWRNASFRGYADYLQTPGKINTLVNARKSRSSKLTKLSPHASTNGELGGDVPRDASRGPAGGYSLNWHSPSGEILAPSLGP